jgi:P4 family phage/plasmid primase-like protien
MEIVPVETQSLQPKSDDSNGHADSEYSHNGYPDIAPMLRGELSPRDRQTLECDSAISPECIAATGYITVTDSRLLEKLDFPRSQWIVPAVLMPIRGADGEPVSYQIRPHSPRKLHSKELKYETRAKDRAAWHCNPTVRHLLSDPHATLYITEGVKKADSFASKGVCAIALTGVWNWRGTNEKGGSTALASFDDIAWKGKDENGNPLQRRVVIVFDSDASEKEGVRSSLRRAGPYFEHRGSKIFYTHLPPSPDGGKTGVDDFFARGGTLDLLHLHTTDAPPQKPRTPEATFTNGKPDESTIEVPGEADTREKLTLGFPLTDTGNGERIISQFGENFLFSPALGFHVWNGQCWAPDETDQVFEWGKKTVRRIYQEAAHADDDQRQKIAAWAKTSESLPRRNAMIEIASKDGPKARADEFDRDQWLFNVQNGTLDLRRGVLLRPDRAHLITKTAPVIYDPRATCPRFLTFLAAVLDGDLETAEFLQRFFGYTLTGSTREQCFLILYGDGSNGKSTLLNVLRWLLGAYCKQTKPDTLMQRKFGDGIPNDVAMLRGARMVTAIETTEGRQFDEAKIKEMTGGDPVSARFFRKEFFEFVPEFKLYLATNHKPKIIGDDAGIWRRVRLVPFNVRFWNPDKAGDSGPEHLRADKSLGDTLREELPGILNWALEGCLHWQRDGLPEPRAVADATEEYRAESDPLETFLAERCFRATHCETPNARLYEEFKQWAEREDENELSQKAFTARMKLKGFENSRGHGGLRRWKGVGLLSMETR